MVRFIAVCLALGIALGLVGCRQGASPSTGAALPDHAANGTETGRGAPGLPEALPIYPGAVTVETPPVHGGGNSLVLESRETPQKVAAFYKSRLLQGGWSLDGEMTVEGEYVLVATKQSRRASALVSDEAGRTRITLTVTRDD